MADIPSQRYPLRGARILLVLMLGAATLWAAEYVVTNSTTTHRTTAHRVRRRPLKKIRARAEKMLTANPKFQEPHSRSLPSNAPVAPKLKPEAPIKVPSGTERFFKGAARVMTTSWNGNIFVWLPAFSTDPNTGPTYGLLPVLVLTEQEHHHIRHLLAPSYTYNGLFGQTITGRYYFYPTDSSQLFTTASYSEHTNREVKIRYENTTLWGGRIFLRAEGYFDADGSLRFYGIGPTSQEGNQSNYTGLDKTVHTDVGFNFLENWRATAGVRYRRFGFDPGIVPGVADLGTRFPQLANFPEQNTMVQEFHLLWDTRDFPVTPALGSSGELFFEKTAKGWGSDSDYIRYGLEGKRFFMWQQGKQTTVVHALYDWANGPNLPFYEMATLGGRDTLRGFGEGRFTDKGRLVFNAEQRIELTSIEMMGVRTRFEVGPFVDCGTVFPRAEDIRRKDFRPVFGGAFRAVVKPNVVGSVDVGVGNEGVGTYVSIDYPF